VPALRVVLAEDDGLLRQGITKLLESEDEVDLVGVAEDLPALIGLMDQLRPDVVVTDIRMPPTGADEGLRAADHARANHPGMGVVVLSQYSEPAYVLQLLGGGSAGRAYLLKERVAGVDDLVGAIREVAAGRSVIDPAVVEVLVTATTRRAASDLDRLTPRETEILAEMAQGKSNAAIATALVLSERAVEKHSNSIFAKLGLTEERELNRRVRAVLVYLSEGNGG
jgi:DNA-binding NarL/FixJ family response regulator